jgi:hypothetical protein
MVDAEELEIIDFLDHSGLVITSLAQRAGLATGLNTATIGEVCR